MYTCQINRFGHDYSLELEDSTTGAFINFDGITFYTDNHADVLNNTIKVLQNLQVSKRDCDDKPRTVEIWDAHRAGLIEILKKLVTIIDNDHPFHIHITTKLNQENTASVGLYFAQGSFDNSNSEDIKIVRNLCIPELIVTDY